MDMLEKTVIQLSRQFAESVEITVTMAQRIVELEKRVEELEKKWRMTANENTKDRF